MSQQALDIDLEVDIEGPKYSEAPLVPRHINFSDNLSQESLNMQEEIKKAPRSYTYIMGEGILRMMGKIASRELKLLAAMNNSQGVEVKVGDQYNE